MKHLLLIALTLTVLSAQEKASLKYDMGKIAEVKKACIKYKIAIDRLPFEQRVTLPMAIKYPSKCMTIDAIELEIEREEMEARYGNDIDAVNAIPIFIEMYTSNVLDK